MREEVASVPKKEQCIQKLMHMILSRNLLKGK